MEFGICNLTVIPVRFEPSDRSEMVTQVLFGETFEIIEKSDKWHKIQLYYDDYEGWIDKKQYAGIDENTFDKIINSPGYIANGLINKAIDMKSDEVVNLFIGSALPCFENDKFRINETEYRFEGNFVKIEKNVNRKHTIENALKYLNSPYLWGGRTPFGIDCSGFTQIVYKLAGIKLFRDARQQATQGKPINFIFEAQPGDLAFFDNDENEIVHVGIIVNENKIIHSSGKVRIDDIDHQGIFNVSLKRYSHKLRIIKQII